MTRSKIKYKLPAITIDMGGLPIKQPLPTGQIGQIDPFLLLHHAAFKAVKGRPAKNQGVGPHPHRGFSPVTFVIQGEIHHRDSRGNSQVAKSGEVQWMHAGLGIIHSERPSEEIAAIGGRQEFIQLWINTPAIKKMIEPSYLHLSTADMPIIEADDKSIQLKLVAGNYQGLSVRSIAQSPLLILWGTAIKKGKMSLEIPENFNATCYVAKGKLTIDAVDIVEKEQLVVFEKGIKAVEITCLEPSEFFFLAGEPIAEEVVKNGPYVMNTQTEIMEAMRDYKMGKMGVLIEDEL